MFAAAAAPAVAPGYGVPNGAGEPGSSRMTLGASDHPVGLHLRLSEPGVLFDVHLPPVRHLGLDRRPVRPHACPRRYGAVEQHGRKLRVGVLLVGGLQVVPELQAHRPGHLASEVIEGHLAVILQLLSEVSRDFLRVLEGLTLTGHEVTVHDDTVCPTVSICGAPTRIGPLGVSAWPCSLITGPPWMVAKYASSDIPVSSA